MPYIVTTTSTTFHDQGYGDLGEFAGQPIAILRAAEPGEFDLTAVARFPNGSEIAVRDDEVDRVVARTAVATLEEVRGNLRATLADRGVWSTAAVEELPAEGGTIELPDGTVIEVAPITRQQLVNQLDARTRHQLWYSNAAAVDVIAAFNQREG